MISALVHIETLKDSIERDIHEMQDDLFRTQMACIERPMRMKDIASIFGITGHGIRAWNIGINSGILFSELYRRVELYKPAKLKYLDTYIDKEVKRRKAVLNYIPKKWH